MSEEEVGTNSVRRWLKRLGVGLLVLVGVLALTLWGGRSYVGRVGTERLTAVTAQVDAADPGWRMDGVIARHGEKTLPPERNSAPVVLRVYDLLPEEWRSKLGRRPIPLPQAPYTPPDPRKTESMLTYQSSTAEARALARTLRGLPDGYLSIDGPEHFRGGSWSYLFRVHDVAKLLHYDAALAGHAGDADGAVEAAHAALNTGRSVGELPIIMAQFTRSACSAVAIGAAQDALVWGEPTRGLAELQAAFAQEADARRLLYALLGMRAWIDDRFTRFDSGALTDEEITGGEPPGTKRAALIGLYRGVSQGEHAEYLRVLNEAVAAARLPFDQQLAAFAAIKPLPDDWKHLGIPLSGGGIGTNNLERYAADQLRMRIDLLAAVAGVACERFRRANGRWPASLDEIPKNILAAVPTDPFDGTPLRVKPTPDGLAVVVTDHQPPPAANRPHGERTAFRLWDPAVRGPDAPPRPPKQPAHPETKP